MNSFILNTDTENFLLPPLHIVKINQYFNRLLDFLWVMFRSLNGHAEIYLRVSSFSKEIRWVFLKAEMICLLKLLYE